MLQLIKKLKNEILLTVFFVISRIPNLGHDLFNTDVWKWKSRIYDFGSGVFGLDFIKTIQKYHPGVTLMWIGSLAVKIFNFYYEAILKVIPPDNDVNTIFGLHFVQKLCIVVVIGIVLAFVYYVLQKLFGTKYALIAILLISLEPFYVALTRVVHLEGLMTSFMIASFVWFYYFLTDSNKKKRLYLSGVFTGLAVLTKTSALFMLPFMGLVALTWYLQDGKKLFDALVNSLKLYWKWILVAVLTFFFVWPAMWTYPVLAIETLYKGIFTVGVEGGHEQFYFLRYTLDPGWLYYLVVFGLRSSILLILGLLGIFLIYKKLPVEKRKFILYIGMFAVLYLIFLTLPSKKLDRYIIPAIVSLLLVAAFYYEYLLDILQNKWKKFGAITFTIIISLALVIPLIAIHPDYFSYYNPLFGGIKTGIKVIEPKWMVGIKPITEFFVKVKDLERYDDFAPQDSFDAMINTDALNNKLVIGFQEKYYTQIWPFINEIGARAVISDITAQANEAKYFVYPFWDDAGLREDRYKLQYVNTIKIRGVNVYNVYKNISEN